MNHGTLSESLSLSELSGHALIACILRCSSLPEWVCSGCLNHLDALSSISIFMAHAAREHPRVGLRRMSELPGHAPIACILRYLSVQEQVCGGCLKYLGMSQGRALKCM